MAWPDVSGFSEDRNGVDLPGQNLRGLGWCSPVPPVHGLALPVADRLSGSRVGVVDLPRSVLACSARPCFVRSG